MKTSKYSFYINEVLVKTKKPYIIKVELEKTQWKLDSMDCWSKIQKKTQQFWTHLPQILEPVLVRALNQVTLAVITGVCKDLY